MLNAMSDIDVLQHRWNINNTKIHNLWNKYPKKVRQLIDMMKQISRKSASNFSITRMKIEVLLNMTRNDVVYTFIGHAPCDMINHLLKTNAKRIYMHTHIKGLELRSHPTWASTLANSKIESLSIKTDFKPTTLINDFMNLHLVEATMQYVLQGDETGGLNSVFSCDLGVNPIMKVGEGFDCMTILRNILSAPSVHFFDTIICKVQNALMYDSRRSDDRVSVMAEQCANFMYKWNYSLSYEKPAGSWMGNDEIYICLTRDPVLIAGFNGDGLSHDDKLMGMAGRMLTYTNNLIAEICNETEKYNPCAGMSISESISYILTRTDQDDRLDKMSLCDKKVKSEIPPLMSVKLPSYATCITMYQKNGSRSAGSNS